MLETTVYALLNLIRRYPSPAFDKTKLSHRIKRRVRWALTELEYATESWTDKDTIARLIADEKYDEARSLLNKMEDFWPGESDWVGLRWEIDHEPLIQESLQKEEEAAEETSAAALFDSFLDGVDTGVVWAMNEIIDLHDAINDPSEPSQARQFIQHKLLEDVLSNLIAAAPADVVDSVQGGQANLSREQVREWLDICHEGNVPSEAPPHRVGDVWEYTEGASLHRGPHEVTHVAEDGGLTLAGIVGTRIPALMVRGGWRRVHCADMDSSPILPPLPEGVPMPLSYMKLSPTIDIDDVE